MKKKNIIAFVLSLVLLLSVVILPDSSVASSLTALGVSSTEPIVPDEDDFDYDVIDVDGVKKVMIYAYNGNASHVIVPETIGGYVVDTLECTTFSANDNLVYVKIPATVENIVDNIFNACLSLEEIEVDPQNPRYVTLDGILYEKETNESSSLFGKPQRLIACPPEKSGAIVIPYGVKTIGACAFEHCYNITSVNMYNTVTKIEFNAFAFCWGITSLRLSDNLKTIGDKAFANCDSLKSISIPATVTSIGKDAFLGGIDSKDNKFYYYTDGIYCTKGTYAYNYVIKQHIPPKAIIQKHRSITDIDTGITFVDAYSVLPANKYVDIKVTPVDINKVTDIPVRYAEGYAYDIKCIDSNGKSYSPTGEFVLNFERIGENAIPNATKIYRVTDSGMISANGSPTIPFVGAQSNKTGRFIVLVNNDFSIKGDVDGDGIITLYDAKAALLASTGILKLTKEQEKAANADNSTKTKPTTADVRKILRQASGIK
ncbi:MAG: leucine-rich repeat domain-containing protein [Ruminococcaceae bacterium]|nr:leucine-rich repeat domain-containing protein [Oscillospiraceae bacterium]